MITQMPASCVRDGVGIPDVCSRHGQPATRRRRMVIESRPPGWTYATIPAGLLIFMILRAVFRKAIVTPAWPFCDGCGRRRTAAILIASAIVAAGVGAIAYGVSALDDDAMSALVLVGLVVAMLGYVGFYWTRLAAIAGTRLIQDGHHVNLNRASPAFVAQLAQINKVPRDHQSASH